MLQTCLFYLDKTTLIYSYCSFIKSIYVEPDTANVTAGLKKRLIKVTLDELP